MRRAHGAATPIEINISILSFHGERASRHPRDHCIKVGFIVRERPACSRESVVIIDRHVGCLRRGRRRVCHVASDGGIRWGHTARAVRLDVCNWTGSRVARRYRTRRRARAPVGERRAYRRTTRRGDDDLTRDAAAGRDRMVCAEVKDDFSGFRWRGRRAHRRQMTRHPCERAEEQQPRKQGPHSETGERLWRRGPRCPLLQTATRCVALWIMKGRMKGRAIFIVRHISYRRPILCPLSA